MRTRNWLLIAAVALAFSPVAAQQKPAAPAPQPKRKATKVWNNDEIEALKDKDRGATPKPAVAEPTFNEYGEEVPAPQAAPAEPAPSAEAAAQQEPEAAAAQTPAGERETPEQAMQKRIARLRADMDKIDAEIRDIQKITTSGNTSGQGIDFTKTDAGLTTQARVDMLNQRKEELRRQIADLEDQARKSGMPASVARP
jgi:hypothetical protein